MNPFAHFIAQQQAMPALRRPDPVATRPAAPYRLPRELVELDARVLAFLANNPESGIGAINNAVHMPRQRLYSVLTRLERLESAIVSKRPDGLRQWSKA